MTTREWYLKNYERIKEIRRNSYHKNKHKILSRRRRRWPLIKETEAMRRKRRRLEVLRHYSNSDTPKCSCCGETIYEFLTFDHMDGGGNKHRQTRGGRTIELWLKKNGYPTNYQVLCLNCNYGKYRGKGICPHKLSN